MNKGMRIGVILIAILALLVWAVRVLQDGEEDAPRASISAALGAGGDTLGGYDRSSPGRPFERASPDYILSFPQDYGAHPDYQTEWWYYTGNLVDPGGRRFGYQLTFFRRALVPLQERQPRQSDWAVEQVYLAHFALSDIEARRFHAFEELSRGAAGLAGAQSEPFQVWLYDWQVTEVNAGVYQLSASQAGLAIHLRLTDTKGPILQGIDGYSQKGAEPGNASHYFSQTRLETEGQVHLQEERYTVSGTSWMDHEFSTSALSEGQVGWDWYSIQLEEGYELMAYQIRRQDGSIDRFSSAALIYPNGTMLHLERDDFTIQVLDEWKSPHSGATYPSGWRLSVPEVELILEIEPFQADQELNLSYSYWEGAVNVSGTLGGAAVSGHGYVELTGYAGSMAGEF
jgi:predicted secreted hydrolase